MTTQTKNKPVHEPKPMKQDNNIPEELLFSFVGEVPRLLKIDQTNLFDDHFRINVWTQHWPEDRVCPTNKIVASYYVKYHEGLIIDKTKKKVVDT